MWPSAPNDTPTVPGNGGLEFDSAGNGKFLSGTMSERVADDTRGFGERLCTFRMVNRDYHLSSPESASRNISWKLNSGSDSQSGAFLRLLNLGFSESVEFTASTLFFLSENRSPRWIQREREWNLVGFSGPAR